MSFKGGSIYSMLHLSIWEWPKHEWPCIASSQHFLVQEKAQLPHSSFAKVFLALTLLASPAGLYIHENLHTNSVWGNAVSLQVENHWIQELVKQRCQTRSLWAKCVMCWPRPRWVSWTGGKSICHVTLPWWREFDIHVVKHQTTQPCYGWAKGLSSQSKLLQPPGIKAKPSHISWLS